MKYTLAFELILLFCPNFLGAQTKTVRIEYDYVAEYSLNYQPDSMSEVRKNATMALLINSTQSMFAAYGNINKDTTKYIGDLIGKKINASTIQPKPDYYFKYYILKKDGDVTTFDQIAVLQGPYFKYIEYSPFKWKLLKDTATINSLKCQSAECNFGNRKWIAWFTVEIPISDGPYKFSGLPGLIVKISDSQNYWIFELVNFRKTKYLYPKRYFLGNVLNSKVVSTDKTNFMELLRDSYENGFEIEKLYGLEFINEVEQQKRYYKDRAKKENNWIELYKGGKARR